MRKLISSLNNRKPEAYTLAILILNGVWFAPFHTTSHTLTLHLSAMWRATSTVHSMMRAQQ